MPSSPSFSAMHHPTTTMTMRKTASMSNYKSWWKIPHHDITIVMGNMILLSIPGNCQMMLNRMRDMVDGELREEQASFRPKHSCAEQIFTIRRITEKYQEYQLPLAVSFIDFTKAFDSIHRPSMCKIIIMRLVTRGDEGITWVKEECLSDLDFADDTAALSDTTQGLQCLVESVGRYVDGWY